jgi:hypothetical protein
VWNERLTDSTPFLRDYEDLLRRYGTDYARVTHRNVDEPRLRTFFSPADFQAHSFANHQSLDAAGLEGRLRSSSYTPVPGQPGFEEMIGRVKAIFERYQENGRVMLEYKTSLYFGHLE